jgi:hypothetical protein
MMPSLNANANDLHYQIEKGGPRQGTQGAGPAATTSGYLLRLVSGQIRRSIREPM